MKRISRQIFLHIIVCFIFLGFPVFSSPDFGSWDMLEIAPFRRSFLSFVFLLLFFYLNYYLLIPKLYFRKKHLSFFVSLVVCYFIVHETPSLLIPDHESDWVKSVVTMPLDQMNFLYAYARTLIQFLAIFFLGLYLRLNRRLRYTEKEQLKAELSYLKAQINPHFLFNTLNSLYALTLEKSDAAPNAVLKLSGMMRYVVTESTNDYVTLEKEIDYISDYIELQRLRIAGEPKLEYTVTGDATGKMISPLIIIPFIENAFKYGVNTEEDWRISIAIRITDDALELDVLNNRVNISLPDDTATGQGIGNTQKRLDLIYSGRHKLEIDDNEKTFRVHLKIQL